MSDKAIIFDLDGTLLDIDPVSGLIGDWEAFHAASLDCPPVPNVLAFAQALQKMFDLFIVTGKPDNYRPRVNSWLRSHDLYPEALLMRPPLNMMPDAELKLFLVQRYFGRGWQDRILFCVEDRDKMVEAWRSAGLTCLQCAPSLY